ncbi:hypothetical protein SAMN05216337_1010158 [Bradyrhizobium brasilense]|uniref:Uncharacterized protein n=1 Tax=Bradyrhizobium brasilense TaxID=1419277 RepID=A0A1G6UAP1_9BRAD|nr:hypothetical protein SAMN05216337_1010158 [Bradyrhizobium brasilense]
MLCSASRVRVSNSPRRLGDLVAVAKVRVPQFLEGTQNQGRLAISSAALGPPRTIKETSGAPLWSGARVSGRLSRIPDKFAELDAKYSPRCMNAKRRSDGSIPRGAIASNVKEQRWVIHATKARERGDRQRHRLGNRSSQSALLLNAERRHGASRCLEEPQIATSIPCPMTIALSQGCFAAPAVAVHRSTARSVPCRSGLSQILTATRMLAARISRTIFIAASVTTDETWQEPRTFLEGLPRARDQP